MTYNPSRSSSVVATGVVTVIAISAAGGEDSSTRRCVQPGESAVSTNDGWPLAGRFLFRDAVGGLPAKWAIGQRWKEWKFQCMRRFKILHQFRNRRGPGCPSNAAFFSKLFLFIKPPTDIWSVTGPGLPKEIPPYHKSWPQPEFTAKPPHF